MKWIRTGRQIGLAVKNAQRMRHIISVLAKYGFVDVVEKMHLEGFLPSKLAAYAASQKDYPTEVRMRMAFEELGPTFIKLGQVLSMRSDLIPEAFVTEFTKLQDNVQPLSYEIVKEIVERELGKPLTELYANFDEIPIGAASIGQVHTAILHTGEKVVVKVQRPEIDKLIQQDVTLLSFLAQLLETYIPESRIVSPAIFVEEFFRTLSFELDYAIEANNIARFSQNLSSISEIVIPKVYRELSTTKVLTLERFEGMRVNDLKSLEVAGVDRKAIVATGARAFFKTVMIDGLFHGDLHGGNLFVLPGNKLGIIDFGIVGRLSQKSRSQLANMVMALLTEDFETLCYQYAELAMAGPAIDFDAFQREVRNTLAPYMGLSLNQINGGKILIEATKIAAKYQIQVPGDWMLVFKAILTIEGMGRTLDPEFDLLSMGRELVKDLVKEHYSVERISKDLLWVAKDLAALFQVLPRQIRWMFRKFNSNDFAFEIKSPDLQNIQKQLDLNGRRHMMTVLCAAFFISAALTLSFQGGYRIGEYPIASILFLSLGTITLLKLSFQKL